MLDNRIKLDERYEDEENGTTTLYFMAPKEMLKTYIPGNDYPEAISMEISIEFPTEHIESNYASVCVSPTRGDTNATEDYDWNDIYLPYDEIEKLIALAEGELNNDFNREREEMNMDRNEIRVPVKGGYIIAGRNSDPDYDGVYVVFETNDGDIMDLALVECKKENEYDTTDVYCFEDVTTEEWTKKYSIQHEDIYEALGEKYNGKNNR